MLPQDGVVSACDRPFGLAGFDKYPTVVGLCNWRLPARHFSSRVRRAGKPRRHAVSFRDSCGLWTRMAAILVGARGERAGDCPPPARFTKLLSASGCASFAISGG